ncbi:diguanylate cyclase (GGDEF)-like protein [Oxalobacteraceae bacterium GrIS 1.18]
MMSIKGKTITAFIVGFCLMGLSVVALLQYKMRESFGAIEHKLALEQMQQLARNLNGELDSLDQVALDWGNWDETYAYMQHPSAAFTEHNFAALTLKTINIKYVGLLDTHHAVVFSQAVNLMTGEPENPVAFESTLNDLKKRLAVPGAESAKACGLDMSTVGPVLLCWEPIRKTDLTGNPVGSLVLARLLNNTLLSKIQNQSNIKFDLTPLAIQESKTTGSQKNRLEAENVEFSKTEPGVLNGMFSNIAGEPILKIRLDFSKYLSAIGAEIIWTQVRTLILIILATGIALYLCMQFFIFTRLQKMGAELKSIWRNGRWAERLELSRFSDELSELGNTINLMLGLIRQQTVELDKIAYTDSLTQIANRRSFEQRILIEMSLHKRNDSPLSLLLIEIDHFKLYNDMYGHPAGDEILIEIAKLLTQVACRPSDLPARIGEEEFAVILPSTDLPGATHVAETLKLRLAVLKIPNANSPISDFITVSIGVTAAGNEDLTALMRRAGQAHDLAKQTGRNKNCVIAPT